MSILDKLWDDTVAGPRPDTGLGKLRKSSTFNLGSSSGKESEGSQEMARVTKRIMIVKPPGNLSKDSPPVSPASASAGSTPPVSPFAGGGGKEAFRFRRRSGPFAYENASGIGPRSPPPPYDL
ncbi:dormancy-associated protein homolog 3 [Nicotiana tabacum]|uniref:Dormancy-associated protein homolog 3 n=1 Tax=Nicotiana tabacum TaxID=4097 RepID=A0A1S3Z857_TOBAC|nr:dormancy-associated protein homolog 3-like isoform X1 [Nicotiana tomentosiformis]XP_016460576.1 PREDICTED: uncharacterized protein LOC107784032 isoform X1 [Nicotiana tabacum]